jgi:hypothetical protein
MCTRVDGLAEALTSVWRCDFNEKERAEPMAPR